ncbi:hypothetical protein [Dyadobacter diqingensis]|uniref:hypothetical protein n=1 Tax=Dyadobacter diqingensis TaxID=2938121 RepID=UPI0020C1AC35|nr:hypothetical protein [Dyadobacter diqingensis]
MDPNINRVAAELNDWKAREERLEKIFSPSILKDPAFLKEKFSFYNHVQAKYGRSANDEEKITLRILAAQRSQLRDQLYPSLLRKLYNLILQPFQQRKILQQVNQKHDSNLKELGDAMKKNGFGYAADQLSQHVSRGQKNFSIPLSHYINENEKMNFNLSFTRQQDGSYRFDQYQASLHKAKDPNQAVSQIFKTDAKDSINAKQAVNLLAGRAVMKEGSDFSGASKPKWIQLDFNDRDPSGNHKVKEFLHNYGFDLDKAAEKLIQKQNLSPESRQNLLEGLRKGEKQPVTITRGNVSVNLFIEANPQFKTLNLYDEQNKKLTMSEALGEKTAKEQIQQLGPKQDLSKQKSRKNGIAI